MGRIFQGSVAAVAASAAQDVFEITAPATHIIDIREIRLGQYSDAGDAAAELVSVQIIRGYTTSGSGGSTPTLYSLQGAGTPAGTYEANNTTLAQTGGGKIALADSFNVQAGWWYRPPADERIQIQPGERVVVRITAPADAVTLNASLVVEEHRI